MLAALVLAVEGKINEPVGLAPINYGCWVWDSTNAEFTGAEVLDNTLTYQGSDTATFSKSIELDWSYEVSIAFLTKQRNDV